MKMANSVKLKKSVAVLTVILCIMLCGNIALAQSPDTANKTFIELSADNVIGFKTDSGDMSKFIGHAVFRQGTDTLYCDSLYQNKTTRILEAYSNVKIAQEGGTQGTSNYLRYISDKKLAYMHGNVSLTDGKNNLKTEDLTYDLGTKVGNYENGGWLHNDSTDVTSRAGVYDVRNKVARFTGDAVINDPQYKIWSDDLEYSTETKFTRFFAKSRLISDSGKTILQTKNGTYDGKKGIAHFIGHSSLWNDGEYIEGDSLDYNKITGYGLGNGNVICIDTAHHSRLFCGHAEYFHKSRVLWASIIPVMEQVNGKDTFYMRGDTFYSAPMVKMKLTKPKTKSPAKITDSTLHVDAAKADTTAPWVDTKKTVGVDTERFSFMTKIDDSISLSAGMTDDTGGLKNDTAGIVGHKKNKAPKRDTVVKQVPPPDYTWIVPTGPKYRKLDTIMHVSLSAEVPASEPRKKHRKGIATPVKVIDTAVADTTAPMFFIAWNHVLLFSDSMQGKCDSIVYTRSDSTIRMINEPIAWAHKSQITGDTILLLLDSNELRNMYVPNNALVVSQSGPDKAQLFDQVQGKTLTAFFKHNEISSMLVWPDAECIYYSKDEHDAYMGVDQGKSVRMLVFFEDQKIVNIKFQDDVHQMVTPMEKADLQNTKLSRFKWLIEERPKTKEELFR